MNLNIINSGFNKYLFFNIFNFMLRNIFKIIIISIFLLLSNNAFWYTETVIFSWSLGWSYAEWGSLSCWTDSDNNWECLANTVLDLSWNLINWNFIYNEHWIVTYSWSLGAWWIAQSPAWVAEKALEYIYNNNKYIILSNQWFTASAWEIIILNVDKKEVVFSQIWAPWPYAYWYSQYNINIHKNKIYIQHASIAYSIYDTVWSIDLDNNYTLSWTETAPSYFEIKSNNYFSNWKIIWYVKTDWITKTQIIYYNKNNLQYELIENTDNWSTFDTITTHILWWELVWSDIYKIFFYSWQDINIDKFKIRISDNITTWNLDVLLSNCSLLWYSWALTWSIYNKTFFAYSPEQQWFLVYWTWFYDEKVWNNRIFTFDDDFIADFWFNCWTNYYYWDYINNIPTSIYIIRGTSFYKAALSESEQWQIIESTTWSWTTWSWTNFWTGGTFTDVEVAESIWNLDVDGDGVISAWEYTIAPITIVKNVIQKLYESLKNIWTFLKEIMKIWNFSFVNNVYADSWILNNITDLTLWVYQWDKQEVSEITDIIQMTKYWFFFALFFSILFLFFYFRFIKN
jgi:hypothetical protein